MNKKQVEISRLLDARQKAEAEEASLLEQPKAFVFELNEVELLKFENLALKKSIAQKELDRIFVQEQSVFENILKRAEKPVEDWFVQIDPNIDSKVLIQPRRKNGN